MINIIFGSTVEISQMVFSGYQKSFSRLFKVNSSYVD